MGPRVTDALYRPVDDELLGRHPPEGTALDVRSDADRSSRLRCDAVVDGGRFGLQAAVGTNDATGTCEVVTPMEELLTSEATKGVLDDDQTVGQGWPRDASAVDGHAVAAADEGTPAAAGWRWHGSG